MHFIRFNVPGRTCEYSCMLVRTSQCVHVFVCEVCVHERVYVRWCICVCVRASMCVCLPQHTLRDLIRIPLDKTISCLRSSACVLLLFQKAVTGLRNSKYILLLVKSSLWLCTGKAENPEIDTYIRVCMLCMLTRHMEWVLSLLLTPAPRIPSSLRSPGVAWHTSTRDWVPGVLPPRILHPPPEWFQPPRGYAHCCERYAVIPDERLSTFQIPPIRLRMHSLPPTFDVFSGGHTAG